MAWDARRTVPWKRLLREWLIVVALFAGLSIFIESFRDPANYVGLLLGGVLYLGFGYVLAKLGYSRATVRRPAAATAQPAAAAPSRNRPAPTKRTSTGPSQRPTRSTKKRRR